MPKHIRVCALQRRTDEWRCNLTLRIHCENVWVAVRDICGSCIRDRGCHVPSWIKNVLDFGHLWMSEMWPRSCVTVAIAPSRFDKFWWNYIGMSVFLGLVLCCENDSGITNTSFPNTSATVYIQIVLYICNIARGWGQGPDRGLKKTRGHCMSTVLWYFHFSLTLWTSTSFFIGARSDHIRIKGGRGWGGYPD